MDARTILEQLSSYKKVIIYGAAACLVTFAAFEIGEEAAENYFKVHGVVTSVQNQQVTVSTRWMDRTVDFSGSPFTADNLEVGQRVKIERNLQGTVINLRTDHPRPMPVMPAAAPPPPHGAAVPPPPPVKPAAFISRYAPSTIADVLVAPVDDSRVAVEGIITQRLNDDDYLLSDAQGNEIIIDADDDRPLPMQQRMRVYGKVDVKATHTEIDVKSIQPVI